MKNILLIQALENLTAALFLWLKAKRVPGETGILIERLLKRLEAYREIPERV
ncbi:hypothetical protein [Faecalicatena contorta]|uniref:hypothetical protein n=1 Tax=Faecalicatena contorta TaxID=39482 RepID=UPI0015E835D8|nr:hypothetical protein [Faecalicatena contorta]